MKRYSLGYIKIPLTGIRLNTLKGIPPNKLKGGIPPNTLNVILWITFIPEAFL